MKKSITCLIALTALFFFGAYPSAFAGCAEDCAHLKKKAEGEAAREGEENASGSWRDCINKCEEKEGEDIRQTYEDGKDYVLEKTEDLREDAAQRYDEGKRKVRNWRRGWRKGAQEAE